MSEKDFYFLLIIGVVAAVGIIGTLASKISDKRFEKKYFRKKRQPRNVTVSTQNVNNK